MEAKISTQTDIVTGLGRFWGELGFETHLRRGVETLGIPKARCFNCNRCKSKQTNKQQQEQKTEISKGYILMRKSAYLLG